VNLNKEVTMRRVYQTGSDARLADEVRPAAVP